MEILMNIWLAFNIVFGINSAFNWLKYFYACLLDYKYIQSNAGQLLDLIVPVSILAYWFSV